MTAASTARTRPHTTRRANPSGAGFGIFMAIALIVIIGLILWALFADGDAEQTTNVAVSVDDITDNPDRYIGQTVTVGGEVNRMLGTNALVLEDDDFIGDDEVLVVGANQLPAGQANEVVLVTGTVSNFNMADAESQLGIDLDNNLFTDWDGRPAIVARSIDVTPLTAGAAQAVQLEAITESPGRFQGQLVSTWGSIDRVIGPRSIVLDNSEFITEDEVLVVGTQQISNFTNVQGDGSALNDAPALVTGTVRTFRVADIETEIGVDLDDTLFRDWEGRSVIVARNVDIRPRPNVGADFPLTPINSINTFFDNADPAMLAGREVVLRTVRVQAIPQPNVYWVGPSADQVVMVVRGAQTPGAAPNVTVGDSITLDGLVLWMPSADRARQLWNLNQDNLDRLQRQEIYVQAEQILVTGNESP